MTGQAEFCRAVLMPDDDVPHGLTDGQNGPAGKRFNVYRNNVAVSLTEALETAFPVVRKLVGEANFKILAGAFLREHPPSSPLLMLYGNDLPGFLAEFPPTSGLRYLPDVARLEQMMRESYHAADATPIDPGRLAEIAPDDLPAQLLTLAPSFKLLRSGWPVYSIWAFNTHDTAKKPVIKGEDVVVLRPEFDPEPVLLNPGDAEFLTAITTEHNLGSAMELAARTTEKFDLSQILTTLITAQAIVDIGAPK